MILYYARHFLARIKIAKIFSDSKRGVIDVMKVEKRRFAHPFFGFNYFNCFSVDEVASELEEEKKKNE